MVSGENVRKSRFEQRLEIRSMVGQTIAIYADGEPETVSKRKEPIWSIVYQVGRQTEDVHPKVGSYGTND